MGVIGVLLSIFLKNFITITFQLGCSIGVFWGVLRVKSRVKTQNYQKHYEFSKKSIFYNNDLPANILKPFYSESPYICSLLTMAFACKKVEKKEEALTFVFFLGKI